MGSTSDLCFLNDPSTMETERAYSASTSTVTPLITKPKEVRTLPQVFDGFRPSSTYNPDAATNGRNFDAKLAAYNTANTALVRRLKGRHLQMIAIGGSIGEQPDTSLFRC